jgi:hypothetical protein
MARTSAPPGDARPQDDGDRRRSRLVDVDRQAPFVVMGVEQWFIALHAVERVVDIQRDRRRRPRAAGAEQIHHRRHHPRDRHLRGRVLQPRHGGLRAQRRPRLRQAPDRQLERRVGAQAVAVVRVLVAGDDGEHAKAQHLDDLVIDPQGIAPIHQAAGQPRGDLQPPLDTAQQHHAAVRRHPAAVEGDAHFLAANRW